MFEYLCPGNNPTDASQRSLSLFLLVGTVWNPNPIGCSKDAVQQHVFVTSVIAQVSSEFFYVVNTVTVDSAPSELERTKHGKNVIDVHVRSPSVKAERATGTRFCLSKSIRNTVQGDQFSYIFYKQTNAKCHATRQINVKYSIRYETMYLKYRRKNYRENLKTVLRYTRRRRAQGRQIHSEKPKYLFVVM